MKKYIRLILLTILSILLLISCGAKVKRSQPLEKSFLTENKLYEIHQDVRFTYFHYADSSVAAGLLLRWEPDSILIQGRGDLKPHMIPTDGVELIETVTGNKIGQGLLLGSLVAGGYFALVRGWELNGVTFVSALGKLLVPPAIIVAGIALGSSRETRETYYLPPGFIFDYNAVKRYKTGQ